LKPKPTAARKSGAAKQVRVLDPKRKLWYEKRLREQAEQVKEAGLTAVVAVPAQPAMHTPSLTRAAASRAGGSLLESLASAKDAKGKNQAKGRAEAWRRKPGDPIF
jgi:hypothetical protein